MKKKFKFQNAEGGCGYRFKEKFQNEIFLKHYKKEEKAGANLLAYE